MDIPVTYDFVHWQDVKGGAAAEMPPGGTGSFSVGCFFPPKPMVCYTWGEFGAPINGRK